MTDDTAARTILTSQKADQFPVAAAAGGTLIGDLRGEERGEACCDVSITPADKGVLAARAALAVVGDVTCDAARTFSRCLLLRAACLFLRCSSLSCSAVDSAAVGLSALVPGEPGSCATSPGPRAPAASPAMLRDASVSEASNAPASCSAGGAGGGGTDASINTAADVGTTSAAKISAACPALRELDLCAPFPFPLPRSLAMSKEDTLSRFH